MRGQWCFLVLVFFFSGVVERGVLRLILDIPGLGITRAKRNAFDYS